MSSDKRDSGASFRAIGVALRQVAAHLLLPKNRSEPSSLSLKGASKFPRNRIFF